MKKNVKVNSEGRIIIPAEIRKALNLKDGDEVEIELTGKEIKVTTKDETCQLCNATENLNRNGDIIVCDDCLETIKLNFHLIKEEFNHE